MKEGCVMGRTIGIVTVALVLAFFGEMASVLNITTQCLLMQRSFWKYYYIDSSWWPWLFKNFVVVTAA